MTYSFVEPDLSASRRPLVDFARAPSRSRLEALADPAATVCLDMRQGTLVEQGDAVVALLADLDPGQRAGLTALGDAGRTVLIAPARTGRPESRRLVAFSHPDGRITEIATYTDDIAPTPPAANDRQLTGTRAVLSAAPHKALTHQRVLVTASTDALGLDVATAFGRAGASVVFHGRRPEFVPPAGGEGAVVTYVCADLDQPNGAVALAEQAASALGGPVTTLVNNLGPWDGTPVSEVSPAAWSAALQSGVTAHLRLSQLVAPGMREAGRGRIYNITTASTSKRSHGTYGFVKAALALLTEALAVELAPEITVNSVAPGQIEESVALMNSLNAAAVPAMLALTPLGRFVTRAEIADVLVALTNPAFDAMTGATIPLAGGYQLSFDEGA